MRKPPLAPHQQAAQVRRERHTPQRSAARMKLGVSQSTRK